MTHLWVVYGHFGYLGCYFVRFEVPKTRFMTKSEVLFIIHENPPDCQAVCKLVSRRQTTIQTY